MTPFIIPIFLPQMGCSYRCLYCHQEKITRRPGTLLDRDAFIHLVEKGLSSPKKEDREVEIAFFGGTFTNLPEDVQKLLLDWTEPYLAQNQITSLRLSTRPEALSPERIERLLDLGVRTIELGVQSLNDTVLERSRRGHTAQEAIEAIKLLKTYPLTIGVQLMTGLPGDCPETFIETVNQVIRLKPHLIRIYPTLVLKNTALAQWWTEGRYSPLSLHDSVTLCAQALELFEEAGIKVIRMGLQEHEGLRLEKDLVAGPHHPAFGSLVRGEWFLRKLLRDLNTQKPLHSPVVLRLAPREGDYLLGNRRRNLTRLTTLLGMSEIRIQIDPQAPPGRGHTP
jgi:histone acetyltransferase (RNA polymerase elongator complex component)